MSDEEHGEAFKMGESFGFDAGYEAGQAAKTPPATAADIDMLWEVIEGLKVRITQLEDDLQGIDDEITILSGDEIQQALNLHFLEETVSRIKTKLGRAQ